MPSLPNDDVTIGPSLTETSAVTPPGGGARTPASSRLAPGSIIAGRYRLVALLGRGGMGEVYRADDLTLDQPVALKFLAAGVAADEDRLAQFHNELRIARQVSHKNVCRLYDLGDTEGRRFLTMEYVDGEDLAALLRRIGRFPQERALEIARQLCAGVAAAHERAVIHRDLKPANVMLDGDGNVRITDFGIATAAGDAGSAIAGTPQYMAPEQLAGKPASIKTDIYALGLILFEVFTGRRAYDAKTLADLKQLHDTDTVTTPSSLVRDLDPAVERIILRCLERDPARRPASALAVAAALPGGNPIAEALATGATPSPEMLAAAGETDALPVGRGLVLFAALLACIAVYALVSPRATMADLVPLDKPPAVLADRAQQIITDFGYTDRPTDTAQSFELGIDYARWIIDTDQTTNRWNRSRLAAGPALTFWYRTSPTALLALGPTLTVTTTDPPMTEAGMSKVVLDTRGRLVEFHRVPPTRDEPTSSAPAPAWEPAFQAAGLLLASFTSVPPEWTPHYFADTRAAWEGPLHEHPDLHVRVEAAAYRGRLVSFLLRGPWSPSSDAAESLAQSPANRVLGVVATVMVLSIYAGAVLLARRNVRANRADRRSAARLVAAYVVAFVAAWIVGGHHLPALSEETTNFFKMLSLALLQAVTAWVLYLALEPYGRRFWPDGLVGWTRLFSGHVRDPRIGRDILIGSALGGGLLIVDVFRRLSPRLIGRPPGLPTLGRDVSALIGLGPLTISWVLQLFGSVEFALLAVTLFVVVRLLVHRTRIAVVISMAILTAALAANAHPGDVLWLYALSQACAVGLATFAMFRYGLLVTAVMLVVDNIPSAVPISPQAASWAAMPGNLSMALVIALAFFGFYAARGKQPLFGKIGDMANG